MTKIRFYPMLVVAALAAGIVRAAETGGDAVSRILEQDGKTLPGDVVRYSWPRRDLSVTIGPVRVQPALALGSWAAFHAQMTMGDLVLLESEVNPVVRALQAGGFEILAVHNHLLSESPHVLYVHFMGKGAPAALAKTLAEALKNSKTPMLASPPLPPGPGETNLLDEFQTALGRKGTMAGTVLQIGIPRAVPIIDGGMEIPPSMGMSESINVEVAGGRIATTGDFVLVADEVNPVLRELQSHGIEVTALHSHMLRETPRLFFMHFWGVGAPGAVGEGLKAALARVATKP